MIHKEAESAGQPWLLQLQALGSVWWHYHQAGCLGSSTIDTYHLHEQECAVFFQTAGVYKALQEVVFECTAEKLTTDLGKDKMWQQLNSMTPELCVQAKGTKNKDRFP